MELIRLKWKSFVTNRNISFSWNNTNLKPCEKMRLNCDLSRFIFSTLCLCNCDICFCSIEVKTGKKLGHSKNRERQRDRNRESRKREREREKSVYGIEARLGNKSQIGKWFLKFLLNQEEAKGVEGKENNSRKIVCWKKS